MGHENGDAKRTTGPPRIPLKHACYAVQTWRSDGGNWPLVACTGPRNCAAVGPPAQRTLDLVGHLDHVRLEFDAPLRVSRALVHGPLNPVGEGLRSLQLGARAGRRAGDAIRLRMITGSHSQSRVAVGWREGWSGDRCRCLTQHRAWQRMTHWDLRISGSRRTGADGRGRCFCSRWRKMPSCRGGPMHGVYKIFTCSFQGSAGGTPTQHRCHNQRSRGSCALEWRAAWRRFQAWQHATRVAPPWQPSMPPQHREYRCH